MEPFFSHSQRLGTNLLKLSDNDMTSIADFYLYVKRPYSRDRRKRYLAHLRSQPAGEAHTRFVVLS
eukprot:scaffold5296_cov163-Amphora_coffeaeformis.AAC.11